MFKSASKTAPDIIFCINCAFVSSGSDKNFANITIIIVYVITHDTNATIALISFFVWSLLKLFLIFSTTLGKCSAPSNHIIINDIGKKNAKNAIATMISTK